MPDRSLTIGLDFDDTYTADPELWDRFVCVASQRGHRVVVVTCRRDTEENRKALQEADLPCLWFYANMGAKETVLRHEHGIEVDIWIDDDPACVNFRR